MKKVLISLFLCLTLTFGMFAFSACKKDDKVSLENLKSDYNSMFENITNIEVKNNEIHIKYEMYTYEPNFTLFNIVSEYNTYESVERYYEVLLQNSMKFNYVYLDACSNKNIKITKSEKSTIEKKISALRLSLVDLSNAVSSLNDKILVSHEVNNYYTISSLTKLKDVFSAYEVVIDRSLSYNLELSKIYFKYASTNANPDYYAAKIENFNAEIAISSLDSKINFQILNATNNYFNMYVAGNNVSENIVSNAYNAISEATFVNYKSSIASLTTDYQSTVGVKINQNQELKQNFFNKMVKLHNLQAVIENDTNKFEEALNTINYSKTKNKEGATEEELICVDIVESYNFVLNEYNQTLIDLLDMIEQAKTL